LRNRDEQRRGSLAGSQDSYGQFSGGPNAFNTSANEADMRVKIKEFFVEATREDGLLN